MSATKQRCGLAVAAYVDNGQGRRLMVATEGRNGGVLEHPVTLATTREEAHAAIAVLRGLAEELPGVEPVVTPPMPREPGTLSAYRQTLADAGHCMADNDGDCDWTGCPQRVKRETTCTRWARTLDTDDA